MANVISGLDAAWAFPDLAGLKAFKAQGGLVVFGYLSGDPSKNWTPARLKMVHSLGLGAGMNFESYANRALEGYGAGLADGEEAWDEVAALVRAVAYAPESHLHIYASADFDAQPSQFPAIDAYLRGFAAGLLNRHANADQAVYGSYTLVVHTAGVGTSKAEWQTYAWSGGQFYTGAEYFQWSNDHNVFGGAVDYDQVINLENLGAWWPPGSPYANGDIVTPADIQAIATAVWNQPITDTNGSKYKAATFLVSANRRAGDAVVAATRAATAAATVAQAAAVDATAVAGAIRDRLIALINGGA